MYRDLNSYLVKRFKACEWEFKRYAGEVNAKNLKMLAPAMRSTKTIEELAFDYSWYLFLYFLGNKILIQ